MSDYYRQIFGEKIFKVPVDMGFDCPNRDGTVAHGDCTFCAASDSGDAIVAPDAPICDQFYKEIDFIHREWPDVKKYLVYFQNLTNTRDTVGTIHECCEQVINEPGVADVNIGARSDYLPDEAIAYVAELSDRMHVTVELDLQTTYDGTSKIINCARTHDLCVETVKRLHQLVPKVGIVSHLINGLPGEMHDMMIENVRRCVTGNEIDGIKPRLLHLMTSTKVRRDYHEGRLKLLGMEEYINIICNQLEIIPKNIIVHRITGDTPCDMLIGPIWSLKRWEVLNVVDKGMERRGSYQGCKLENGEIML